MNAGVVVFPGSNCDKDTHWSLSHLDGAEWNVSYFWHDDNELGDIDFVVLPGGFSYGDYLRTGAFARFSPIMRAVTDFAENGGIVLGICNGFQILQEAGLLPGAMLPNKSLRFICDWTNITVENNSSPFTANIDIGTVLKIPIAHFEGNFFCDSDNLGKIESNKRVAFRYSDSDGNVIPAANPNGSMNNIAGIVDERGNVLGMMPHPERASEKILGSDDGKLIFKSVAKFLGSRKI